jgi:glutathione S-transferase
MSEGKMTLTYFDLYGRGEACRMALAHGKCDWEDNRVGGETWAAFKAKNLPADGQVPVLEVDGKFLNQSEAICRFIGAKTGAYPIGDAFACHFADSVINTCSDFEKSGPKSEDGKPLMYKMFGPDPLSEEDVAQMVEARKKFHAKMASMLGDKTFFGGDKPSIGDFWVCALIYSWERNTKGKESQAHVYKAHADALAENVTLTAWADKMAEELADYLPTRGSGSL